LNTHGFGFVWLNQGVENHIQFLSIFEQRCKDIYCQNWRSETDSHNRRFYLNIKTGFDMEEYIKNVTLFKHRRCITLIRTCSHNLNFNNRCQNPIDGLCRLCDLEEVEDEFHFCLVCPAYSSPRENLLPSHYWRSPTHNKLYSLLSDQNVSINLAKYLYVAFCIRKSSRDIM